MLPWTSVENVLSKSSNLQVNYLWEPWKWRKCAQARQGSHPHPPNRPKPFAGWFGRLELRPQTHQASSAEFSTGDAPLWHRTVSCALVFFVFHCFFPSISFLGIFSFPPHLCGGLLRNFTWWPGRRPKSRMWSSWTEREEISKLSSWCTRKAVANSPLPVAEQTVEVCSKLSKL